MARLAVIEDGIAVNVINGDPEDFPNAEDVTGTPVSKGWIKRTDGTWDRPPKPVPKWSKTQFLQRFTRKERIGIRQASSSDNVVADFHEMLTLSEVIDPNDADVIEGMDYLVNADLLTQQRRDEILSY